jgi:hypothetical protein
MRFISTSLRPPRSILLSILHPPTQTRSRQPVIYILYSRRWTNSTSSPQDTRKKNTCNILLLCITNLVCLQVACPCMWYRIYLDRNTVAIWHVIFIHQLTRPSLFLPTSKHTEGDAAIAHQYKLQSLRRADAEVVPMLTSRCPCCLLYHCLPISVPWEAAGPQRRKKRSNCNTLTRLTFLLTPNIYYIRLCFVTALLTKYKTSNTHTFHQWCKEINVLKLYAWFQDSAAKYMRNEFSSVITQRVVVILYRPFEKTIGAIFKEWPLKMGPIGCLETSIRIYKYSLHNNPEERNSRIKTLVKSRQTKNRQ